MKNEAFFCATGSASAFSSDWKTLGMIAKTLAAPAAHEALSNGRVEYNARRLIRVAIKSSADVGLSWADKTPVLWPGFHDAGFERPVL